MPSPHPRAIHGPDVIRIAGDDLPRAHRFLRLGRCRGRGSGLGRSRMLRTVEAATNTPNPHSTMAMRQRPQSGFSRKISQINSAISRGVLFTGSFGSFPFPNLPSSNPFSHRRTLEQKPPASP